MIKLPCKHITLFECPELGFVMINQLSIGQMDATLMTAEIYLIEIVKCRIRRKYGPVPRWAGVRRHSDHRNSRIGSHVSMWTSSKIAVDKRWNASAKDGECCEELHGYVGL